MISPGTVPGRTSLTGLQFVDERQNWSSTNRCGILARPSRAVTDSVREEEEPVSPVVCSRLALARWVRSAVRQVAVRDLAQLYRHPAGDDSLAGPLQRLIHVSRFQYRKAT